MKKFTLAAALAILAAPAFAQDLAPTIGDAANGEEQFNRQCVACHIVADADGNVLAGRNSRTGPNQYGLVGRALGSVEDFNYSDGLVALGEAGEVWNEENFVGYVQDPTGWLREKLEDRRARGKMAYQVRSEQDAYDLYAYLATFSDM
ncbi:c-type cytochrome [Yoonia vestfoldensis]|jgi:cytochrome c|uniref:Cytochrome c2 n=1 Tax=Yoonia vestfoldensis TaxID=245188 RepID=A0A1Y0EGY0_9RHOB|nr:c-type cytochrome [Yoonia vestfoldensis]ARU02886.1 cytochrome c2 [Yoonia vestfoldensis]